MEPDKPDKSLEASRRLQVVYPGSCIFDWELEGMFQAQPLVQMG